MGIVQKHNPEGVVRTLAEAVDAYMPSTRETAGFTRFVLPSANLAATAAREGDGELATAMTITKPRPTSSPHLTTKRTPTSRRFFSSWQNPM
ncbi:hypothetical protein CF327_g7746 [Tilletia walkeri]|uniref:Uncharacterized protein n=1 Tax=Tilletia walkeri TaxID=117179 RepID=A0A8X7T133_9BASI|nr:hypothetical protein CF327_g7746 [Tilletia walkeri]KAE8261118.1 hypothetical protein A4X09_0g7711 [Tilletia walkeri]